MIHPVEPFNSGQHANGHSIYSQNTIVTGEIPVAALKFSTAEDELAPVFRAQGIVRDPQSCPSLDTLAARPEQPHPITGYEKKQHLSVSCVARQNVVGPDKVTAYGVCAIKAAERGIESFDGLRRSWITNPEKRQQIACPFLYLGAIVESAVAGESVRVAVDAVNPVLQPRHDVR